MAIPRTSPPHDSTREESDDVLQLDRAFNGSGCVNSTVIDILACRNDEQRDHIRRVYQAMYGKDIVELLASKLRGDFKNLVLLWMPSSAERDAKFIRYSFTAPFKWLTNAVFNTKPANEVICSRPASTIQSIKQCYLLEFETTLENDIKSYTSGDHQKILLSLVTEPRDEGPEFDRVAANQDAEALHEAGGRRTGTDCDTFIRIFSGRSSAHLAHVASAYANMYETSLEEVIKKETSGNFRQCLSIILQCAENSAAYFAEELHKSMNRMGTNDSALIRLIVSRAEIDLPAIKAEYEMKYRKLLRDAVYSDTSGHYRDFLLALLG